MEREPYLIILWSWAGVGLATFILLLFVTAPYGRHSRKGWGPVIPNRMGWILMELTSLVIFILSFLSGPGSIQPVAWIFFALYVFHYTNRSIVYPFRTRTSGKTMPLVVVLMAAFFNLVNGYLNGTWFAAFAWEYTVEWLSDARFISGFLLFAAGVYINWQSDRILLKLRNGDRSDYSIPEGGFFRWVSCPNFLGEIIEWTGFAVMTWSPAALVFVLWTVFNLVPRALDHHKWYKARFTAYPARRKAILPYLL